MISNRLILVSLVLLEYRLDSVSFKTAKSPASEVSKLKPSEDVFLDLV